MLKSVFTFPCFENAFMHSLQHPFLTINDSSCSYFSYKSVSGPFSTSDLFEEESKTESSDELLLFGFYFESLVWSILFEEKLLSFELSFTIGLSTTVVRDQLNGNAWSF